VLHRATDIRIDNLAYNRESNGTGVEALDDFLLIGRGQIETILEDYVPFYNSQRPHQGIRQQIPKPVELEKKGDAIGRSAVLGALHHPY
jgi:hypothetical protein